MAVTTSGNPQSDQLTNLRPTGGTAEVRAPVQTTPALTVILPCYNEAERLRRGRCRLCSDHLPAVPGAAEVLVVDDGSTDATVTVAAAVAAVDGRVRVLSYRPNRGKGFAVRTRMLAAQGELVVFTDADGSYQPSDLDRVVKALDQAPVAIGTRAGGACGPVARRAASRAFNLAIRGALGLPFGDTQSGLKGFPMSHRLRRWPPQPAPRTLDRAGRWWGRAARDDDSEPPHRPRPRLAVSW